MQMVALSRASILAGGQLERCQWLWAARCRAVWRADNLSCPRPNSSSPPALSYDDRCSSAATAGQLASQQTRAEVSRESRSANMRA